MVRQLPLFPLNLVVFPGEKLNLHIFEPRYKQLIEDCRSGSGTFGIPAFLEEGVTELGTELKLLAVEKTYAGGEMDIRAKGIGVFRIKEFKKQLPGKLYAGGMVEAVEQINDADPVNRAAMLELLHELHQALGIQSLYLSPPEPFSCFDLGHHLGLSLQQEYELLQLRRESERQDFLLSHLRIVLPVVQETERLKERVKLNGHFRHLTPPSF